MERRRITCPQTAHLEEIELEHTPAGVVIASCTRFSPPCAVDCARECARRLDRRERGDDHTERVLVAHAGHLQTAAIARALAAELAHDGVIVDVADLDSPGAPPPEDYEAVVIASPVHLGRFARSAIGYVKHHVAALADMPGVAIAVSGARGAGRALERLSRRTHWQPALGVSFDRGGWFGDPDAYVPPDRIHKLALAIADELPAGLAL